MQYQNLPNILNNLGVYKNILSLIHNNQFFYKKLANISQQGCDYKIQGGDYKIQGGDYKITLPDFEDDIVIKEYHIDKTKAYSIMTKQLNKLNRWEEDNMGTSCLLMLKEGKTMHIESINAFDTCVTLKGKQLNGSFLLNIAIGFIESIKDKEKINQISLIDKAEMACHNSQIQLSDFKILISGDSWYGDDKYGFTPAKVINGKYYIDENLLKKYNKNKKIIKKLTVKDSKIIDIIIRKENEKLDKLLLYMQQNIDNKLSLVIASYLPINKFKKRCLSISLIIEDLFYENGLESFSNRAFIKSI